MTMYNYVCLYKTMYDYVWLYIAHTGPEPKHMCQKSVAQVSQWGFCVDHVWKYEKSGKKS